MSLAKSFSSEIVVVNVFQNPAAHEINNGILEKAKNILE
jgi:hypothetical protein